MATIKSIITAGDKILFKAPHQLIGGTRAIEYLIFDALMELFNNVDVSGGKISSTPKAEEFLASLDYRIYQVLRKNGYGEQVTNYLGNFDNLASNLQDLHQAIGNGILPAKDLQAIRRIEVLTASENLTEKGLYKDIIAPIRKDLYRNIQFGATLEETEKVIRSYVVSTEGNDSRLIKYIGQIATDAIHQYDGSVNQATKDRLGLNAIQYVGSIIDDSRAQCMKWTDGKTIKDADMKAQIEFATTGGYYKGKKCSGMIPGTSISNFCILRGGYRCRHRAIPIHLVTK